ncbi:MAG TPA: hypothetical protein VME23_08445 [Terracidiphilus sp.]|nr:hypothetical protein [Terracidiphilus sp.]
MNLVVMLERRPDWIMLTNAVTIKINNSASAIRMLADPNLNLGNVNLGDQDSLYLIGHANTDQAGDYDTKSLATALRDRGLPKSHRVIVLPSSCEVAQDTPKGSFIQRFLLELAELGYHNINVTGAVGLAISGWGVSQVVNPANENAYLAQEGAAIGENQGFIDDAKLIAATINEHSPSHAIMAAGNQIAMLTEYFYENLIRKAHTHLMPPGTGIKTVAMKMFRLRLTTDTAKSMPAYRASLNRSPQRVVVWIASKEMQCTHWAWERASVLRIEAPGNLLAEASQAGRVCFFNPDFAIAFDGVEAVN